MKTFDDVSKNSKITFQFTFEELISKVSKYTSDVSIVLLLYTFFMWDLVANTIINHYNYIFSMILYAIIPAVFYVVSIFIYSKNTLNIRLPLLMPFISFYIFSFFVAYHLIFLSNVILDSSEEEYTNCNVIKNARQWRPKKNTNMSDKFFLYFECPSISVFFDLNTGYGLYHHYKNNPNDTVNVGFKEGYWGFKWVSSYPIMPRSIQSEKILTFER